MREMVFNELVKNEKNKKRRKKKKEEKKQENKKKTREKCWEHRVKKKIKDRGNMAFWGIKKNKLTK